MAPFSLRISIKKEQRSIISVTYFDLGGIVNNMNGLIDK